MTARWASAGVVPWVIAALLAAPLSSEAARPAQLDEAPQGPARAAGRFEVEPLRASLLTGGMLLAAALLERETRAWSGPPCAGEAQLPPLETPGGLIRGLCDPARLVAADAWVARQSWATARPLSDWTVSGLLLAPYGALTVVSALDGAPLGAFAEDALLITQTLAATLVITNVAKSLVRRPRPLTYNPDFDEVQRFEGDARLSFPSGHSSMSFAAASVLGVILLHRYGGTPAVLGITAAGYLAASGVAFLRMAAGKHFFTDVLAGAILGTTVGVGLPLLAARSRGGATEAATAGVASGMGPAVLGFGGTF